MIRNGFQYRLTRILGPDSRIKLERHGQIRATEGGFVVGTGGLKDVDSEYAANKRSECDVFTKGDWQAGLHENVVKAVVVDHIVGNIGNARSQLESDHVGELAAVGDSGFEVEPFEFEIIVATHAEGQTIPLFGGQGDADFIVVVDSIVVIQVVTIEKASGNWTEIIADAARQVELVVVAFPKGAIPCAKGDRQFVGHGVGCGQVSVEEVVAEFEPTEFVGRGIAYCKRGAQRGAGRRDFFGDDALTGGGAGEGRTAKREAGDDGQDGVVLHTVLSGCRTGLLGWRPSFHFGNIYCHLPEENFRIKQKSHKICHFCPKVRQKWTYLFEISELFLVYFLIP